MHVCMVDVYGFQFPLAFSYIKPLMCLQDAFVARVLRTKETITRTKSNRKRGWYTVERMKTKLGWSSLLVYMYKSGLNMGRAAMMFDK